MLRSALATLPRTLDQTYDRILCAISEEYSEYAMRILQWLAFSARPLSVDEIAEVVALNAARDPVFDRDEVLEDPLEVLKICSSLITITNKPVGRWSYVQRSVALAHYSVQEYLVSDRIKQGQAKQYSMQEAECHNAIARGSLKYLLQFQEPLSNEVLRASALAMYALEFWTSHLRKTEDNTEEPSWIAVDLLTTGNPAYLAWIRLCNPDPKRIVKMKRKHQTVVAPPLYYAALLGLKTVTRMLLDKSADVNAQGGVYNNALQAASQGGYKEIVKMLLNKGANVNAQGGRYSNALQAASQGGYKETIKLLLETGADVNMQGGVYDNALQAASYRGHEQVVEMLLGKGADVNGQSGHYGNALHAASGGGYEQVVQKLLGKGADVNAQGGVFGNALQAASYKGHEQVVKMLLDKGADVNAQGGYSGNALQAASEGGHEQVVNMLLDAGAHPPKENAVVAVLE
jgi:ankyrin repeat protein